MKSDNSTKAVTIILRYNSSNNTVSLFDKDGNKKNISFCIRVIGPYDGDGDGNVVGLKTGADVGLKTGCFVGYEVGCRVG